MGRQTVSATVTDTDTGHSPPKYSCFHFELVIRALVMADNAVDVEKQPSPIGKATGSSKTQGQCEDSISRDQSQPGDVSSPYSAPSQNYEQVLFLLLAEMRHMNETRERPLDRPTRILSEQEIQGLAILFAIIFGMVTFAVWRTSDLFSQHGNCRSRNANLLNLFDFCTSDFGVRQRRSSTQDVC